MFTFKIFKETEENLFLLLSMLFSFFQRLVIVYFSRKLFVSKKILFTQTKKFSRGPSN